MPRACSRLRGRSSTRKAVRTLNLTQAKAIEEAFSTIDSDHNGSLDTAELMTAFSDKIDKAHGAGLLQQMIKSIDRDGNGTVELKELIQITV